MSDPSDQSALPVVSVSDQDLRRALKATREHSVNYVTKAGFRAEWLGLGARSRDYLAQQFRVFGELLDPVTRNLEGWKILDVGCGDGRWLRRMVEYDARPEDVIGVDISTERFQIGQYKNPKIKLIEIDGLSYPFEDQVFDLVTQFVCFSTIPTEALRRRTAHEIERVTKRGGYMFWWDQRVMDAQADRGGDLRPQDYFDWPVRCLGVGQRPSPSETLRPFRGRRLVAPLLDRLRHPTTHVAALIGPKP